MSKYYMVKCHGCGKRRRSSGVQKTQVKEGACWVWRGYCKECREKRVSEQKASA